MSNKLDDLINKFNEEGNVTGERIAEALKTYLCEFTEELRNNIMFEQNSQNRVVNKVKNMMINCADKGDYSARHMFPVITGKDFNILSKEIDDKVVLKRLNAGIRSCQNGKGIELNGIEIGSYKYKVPVGYVYANVTKTQLDQIMKAENNSLVVVDKSGKSHKLDYYLVWSDIAVSKCKKLWQLSRLYKDEEPIVFAPYAKRLFRIEIDIEEIAAQKGIQIESLNFLLKENGIENYVMLGKELVWNVEIKNQAEFSKKVTPIADVVHWKYFFKDLSPHQYILPKDSSWPTFRIETAMGEEVRFDFEYEYPGEFERISVFEINANDFGKEKIYWTNYNVQKLAKQSRIRSFADAYYEAKKLESVFPAGVKISGIRPNLPDGKKMVEKYPTNMTVYDKGRFGYKNTNRLFVVFDCERDDLLGVDYFNFVLGYLTFCFPEIGWEGAI